MRHLLSVLYVLFVFLAQGQVDFNQYTTLLSSGPIPEDFTQRTYNKLESDIIGSTEDMSNAEKKVFYTKTNYSVDGLMHSGSVLFGDPITEYIEAVAKKILQKDKALFRELRFYALKSNTSNAFSTEQGIVFVTTGLLSQITSEAQLAFVLAHEISHYTQEHVLDSYSYQQENRSASIEHMSVYSKDRELEADRLGLELYASAGYSKDEIVPTFDVLLYSYLPFDELQVPNSYFTDLDSLFVPNSLFPVEPYEIKAVEDEDDSRSSHPNIKTRKDQIQSEIDRVKNWRNETFKLGEERFREVRNIARFEVVRINMHEAEYAKAIYSIFLLEQEFPTSMFLKRMKAQAWLGILQYRLENSIYSVVDRKSKLEGASANVHHFIKEMSKDQLITMCVRQVTDVFNQASEDEEISKIYDRMIFVIANTDVFTLEEYATQSFQTFYEGALQQDTMNRSDSIQSLSEDKKEISKYDRIKGKNIRDNSATPDSSDFHLYLIPDVVTHPEFLELYNDYHTAFKKKEEEADAYRQMTAKERFYFDQKKKKERNISVKENVDYLISMEPIVFKYGTKGLKYVKSERTQEGTRESIDIAARKANLQVAHLDRKTLELEGTQAYNDRSILMNFLEQSANDTDINSFPVDYALVQGVSEKFGTPYVMYSVASHEYAPDFNAMGIFYSIALFPSIPFYFPIKLFMGNQSEINMIVIDLESGKLIGAMSHEFRSTLRKHVLGAHIYSLLDTLKQN